MKRFYGEIYTRLSDVNRRGFVNHHMAGGMKIIMIVVAAYPFIAVTFGRSSVHSPFGNSKIATHGDGM